MDVKGIRDIIFRGKRIDDGEWVEGYFVNLWLVNYQKHQPIITDNNAVSYDVDPSTVGQYTGLTDKNDKKIFEGDIVLAPYIDPIFKCTWNDTSPCEKAIVIYCMGMFYVEYIESGDKFTLSAMDGYMKIIGNICDNPELLGGKEDDLG